jgi:prepilin-type N-terminal cleavage/methylation domain-containing protein
MEINKQSRKGFTLMEILISIGILATVGTLITQVLFTTMHVNTKSGILTDIKQNGEFAMDSMGRLVRVAGTIETVCGQGKLTSDTAIIRDGEGQTITFSCVSDGTTARIASTSASGTAYLTGDSVTLSASGATTCADSTLAFSCPSAGSTTMSIHFTLRQIGTSPDTYTGAENAFDSTVNIRK